MPDLANKFSFDAIKFNGVIAACLVLIWLVVLVAAVSSVLSQSFSRRQRGFWLALVIFLPVIGMLLYLPFSVKRDDYPLLFSWKNKK